jgi:non-ribosomal peptide synthase protein (TIGR01720 family)
MLGIDRVGIHDNFFELGGDSVVNIQIAARANQAGVRVTPRQVFEHQTIAELAALAGSGKAVIFEQGDVTGTVPLTPIQQWFFERELPHPEHFNMPMLLEVQRPMDMTVLARSVERLVRHHDALRLRYSKTEKGWKQQLVEAGPVKVQKIDLAGLPLAEQLRRIEAAGTEIQKSLDLEMGPLLQAAYFDLGPNQPGRLLLAIHHLVVDMVSWRILLEDLRALCEALSAGREAALPAKTTSIKRWAEALTEYAQTEDARAELDYWLSIGSKPVPRLPVDLEQGSNTVGSSATLEEELSVEETRALLADLPQAYKTQINDALLLALVKAICGWTGGSSALLDLEGHGREAIVDGVDVSRTVGWFTTLSPLRLELPDARGFGHQIGAMQEQLRAIPHHGMGFGVLRYLSANPATRSTLDKLPKPELSFLYMGQFDAGVASGAWLAPAPDSPGAAHDAAAERRHLLEVNSIVSGGRLRVSWTYSRNRHRDETARSLARAFMDELRSLVASCPKGKPNRDAAPGSVAGRVSDSDLAEISRQLGATARVVR